MFPYCKHALLTPPECFGLTLRPFSLGHIDLLTALEHPVVQGDFAGMKPADVATAAWVCSKTYEEAVELYRTGGASRQVAKLGRLGEKKGGVWIGRQAGILTDYFYTYFMSPPRWDPKSPINPPVPWHLSVFCALQKDLAYSPGELMAMPLPRALELFAAVCANRGDESLLTIQEQEIKDMMDQEESQ
jgi:hypothetical protein